MQTRYPLISVVIPCYNYGHYLGESLSSVLNQTYKNLEIVCVNDGSTDNTDEAIKPFLHDPRVRYMKQENAGQAKARNVGIRNSSGSLIAFLDADDKWEEDKLEKQVPLFGDEKVGVVYSRSRFMGPEGEKLDLETTGRYVQPCAGYVAQQLFCDNFVPFSSCVIRREALEKVGLFSTSAEPSEDWDLLLRASVYYNFAYIDEPLLVYRRGHFGQVSSNTERVYTAQNLIRQKFLDAHPNIVPGSIIRNAMMHRYLSRGYTYEDTSLKESARYYGKAFMTKPLSPGVYKGICRMVLKSLRPFLRFDKSARQFPGNRDS
jgi:glycosyltransferase involved in cell wall biosynthesis